MEQSLHYLLMAAHSAVHKEVFARLRDADLSSGQPKVLDHLHVHDGDSQKDIARGCHIEPGSLTTLLKGMEAKGLVERRSLNGNRKNSHIFMTDKGRAADARVQQAFSEMEAVAFQGIDEEERARFLQTLGKISANLDNYNERSDGSDRQ